MIFENLRAIKKYSSLSEIFSDKNLAKLGDTFVNFLYSLAKSYTTGKFDAWKVPDKVLAQALRDAELRAFITKRASTHDLGDAVEAFLIHEWLFQNISIEELIQILAQHLKVGNFSDRKKEARIAIQAFTAILLDLKKKYVIKK
ncbi:MAG: ribonuclease III family protein [Candidatus Helarchaeota archaeon]